VDSANTVERKHADLMRREHMDEEQERDPVHKCLFTDERCRDFGTNENLLELIGYLGYLPAAYAGFEMCTCKVLIWRFFYIPKQLRKLSLSLPFAREVMKVFHKQMGPDIKIEIAWNVNNRTMNMICRYLGLKVIYQTGVTTVGEILERGKDSRSGPV
jgi:hypothetical protein